MFILSDFLGRSLLKSTSIYVLYKQWHMNCYDKAFLRKQCTYVAIYGVIDSKSLIRLSPEYSFIWDLWHKTDIWDSA